MFEEENPFQTAPESIKKSERYGLIQIIKGTIPAKSNSYRIIHFKKKGGEPGHPSLAKTKELKLYEESFYWQCNGYRNANIDEEFEIEVDVYYPSKRADVDNSLKLLLDCLQKINAIKNDNKCVSIKARRFVDKDEPKIKFVLRRASELTLAKPL